jgi:anhydro-N-acetylmuramic acid kinase
VSLQTLLRTPERLVVGLMSGTSLDGIDAAVVRLAGSGQHLRFEVLGYASQPMDSDLRAVIRQVAENDAAPATLARLHVRLAHAFADAADAAAESAGLPLGALDLAGSHGQTVQHLPAPTPLAGRAVAATLQIGDAATLAHRLGCPVAYDFRPADLARGGQGAPLVPYFDWAAFGHETEARLLLNLGGIANVSVLPAGCDVGDVGTFDTGPGNMVVDQLAARFFDQAYDRDGALGASGNVCEPLLHTLLEEDYFGQPPPKSTGRERFGRAFVDRLIERGEALGCAPADLVATATALTARSVAQAVERFGPEASADVLIASGGGVRNPTLMRMLADALPGLRVESTAAYGLDPDAKEAVCFAVLAHELLNEQPTSLPRVTGAARPALLGSLCLG